MWSPNYILCSYAVYLCSLSSNRVAIARHASVVYILSLMMLYRVLKLVGFTVKKESGKVVGRAWERTEEFRK